MKDNLKYIVREFENFEKKVKNNLAEMLTEAGQIYFGMEREAAEINNQNELIQKSLYRAAEMIETLVNAHDNGGVTDALARDARITLNMLVNGVERIKYPMMAEEFARFRTKLYRDAEYAQRRQAEKEAEEREKNNGTPKDKE